MSNPFLWFIIVVIVIPAVGLLIYYLYDKIIVGKKYRGVNTRKHGPSYYESMGFKPQSHTGLYPDEIERRIDSLLNAVQSLRNRVDKIEKRISDWATNRHYIDSEQGSMQPGQIKKNNNGEEMNDKTGNQVQADRYEGRYHEPSRVRREREKYDHLQPGKTGPEVSVYGYIEEEEEDYESLYNRAIGDQGKRNKFWEICRPIRVGVANSMDRRRDPGIEPEFQDEDGGDYLAVIIKDEAQLYAVFPGFDILLEESNYMPGAMGRVFECRDYEEQYRYNIVEVVKPAVFKRKAGNKWEIQKQGTIKLEKRDE